MGQGQRPWAWPPAELGRDEALFQQAPQQGSFPGAFNAQTAPEGETLLVSQDLFHKQGSETGACTGRQDSWKALSSLTELQEWHQAPVGKWQRTGSTSRVVILRAALLRVPS